MLTSGLVALGVGLATLVMTRPMLRWLREPADAPDKPLYRDLGSVGFLTVCATASAAAALIAWWALPRPIQPMWWVLSSVGVVLAAIDARTTWLPLPLTQLCWGLMVLGALAGPLWGGTWRMVLYAGVGAAAAGLLYLVVWLISRGGFGFGDVRFAPLLGAATAAHSWSMLWSALVLGTLIGAGHGLVRLSRRRPGGFPYAPSMLAGAYLACWWV